jgi:hypothetical protein
MAIVQLRHDTDGRRYYRRRLAESKSPMEAMRALNLIFKVCGFVLPGFRCCCGVSA